MAQTEEKLLSISKLGMRFDLDRATIRKRLEAANIEPHSEKEKEKLYLLTEELEAAILNKSDKLDAAKLRKETADAELKEIKVAEARGEMASVAEFTEAVQMIFGSLHKKLAVQFPKRIALRLSKAATQNEIAEILAQEIGKEFSDLRNNHAAYLKK